MGEWDKTPYAENSDNANVAAGCRYCIVTIDADGEVEHEDVCTGNEVVLLRAQVTTLRASRLRLARALVEANKAITRIDWACRECVGSHVDVGAGGVGFVCAYHEARRIVRGGGGR